MEFPCEIQTIINDYAKPASAMLRENWREGSSIIEFLEEDPWWSDYINQCLYQDDEDTTWSEWCEDKMIIGPPRHRSPREEAELDEDYLTMEDIIRHCRPWSKTWPAPDDRSWCTGPYRTTLPDWAIEEYLAAK